MTSFIKLLILQTILLIIVSCQNGRQMYHGNNYLRYHGIIQPTQPSHVRRWIVLLGRKVVLNCSVNLPPEVNPSQVQYRWEHPEGNILGYSKLYVIPNVTMNDAGVYTCHSSAYVGFGGEQWVDQHRLYLEVQDDISMAGGDRNSEPTIVLNPGDPGPLDVNFGELLYSRCSVLDSNQYSYRWIQRAPDGTIKEISSDARLYITNFGPEHLQYPLRCEVTRLSDDETFEKVLNLRLAMQHIVNIRPITGEVIIGRPYEMVCEVEPQPEEPISFVWYHNAKVVHREALLRLNSLSYRDIGMYICRAEWTPRYSRTAISANATAELSLALTRETKIEMSPPPGSVMVSLPGETRELHCEFPVANPRDVRWYFENQLLENHPTVNATGKIFRIDRLRVSIVTIRGIEYDHGGTYECRIGRDIKQAHLVVRAEEGLEINPKSDTVDEGEAVEFHCRVHGMDGNINRQLEWYYRPFYSSTRVRLDVDTPDSFMRHDDLVAQHTSFISKSRARVADQGEYICRLPSQNEEIVGKLFVRAVKSYILTITPQRLTVRPYQPVEFECFAASEDGQPAPFTPRFRVIDSRISFETTRVSENRVRFVLQRGLGPDQNGTIVECLSDEPSKPTSAIITVEDICPDGSRRCRSGQCLPAGRFCDGVRDCDDGSDEDPKMCNICDPLSRKCEYYQGKESTVSTFMVHWTCDGENDCGNGFDESNCEARASERCQDRMFSCRRDGRQIPMAFVCDKDRDCSDGEDELTCAPPMIAEPRTTRYSVRRGDTVVLVCEVTGNPVPYVIWRFNWGCLPEEPNRFRISNVPRNCNAPMPTVVSTLTISNVRPGDDGIYNCEGLSGATRALSNDLVVMIGG
ncbi:unnamed protein product [Schistosoma guineensis]|nr:unnamed protein product [Schistosoma guineensis]CAH8664344.1 unnamed protein product [Schistosoma bovis]CAH8669501.1 unnamed protein product [Schistosoma bovis]